MKFYANDIASLSQRRLRPSFIDDLQFSSFLDALPDGAALLEIDGRIKLVNGKLEVLLNLSRGDLVGTELGKHVKTAGSLIQKLWTALQQLKRVELAGTLNSQRNVVATLSILRTADGGAYGALLTMREAGRHARLPDGSDNFRFEAETSARASFLHTADIDRIVQQAGTALERGANLLLTGETGTGKTELARMIGASQDANTPFVHVRCGMLSDTQFEVEMFGIEPGSPMDTSTRGKLGYVEAADGGILFLDQITDLSPLSQAKLVAFLEAQTFSRLGSTQRRQARIKLIAATNQNIAELVGNGAFRRDLYYRIAVMDFALAPLRDQPDLLRMLVDHHLRRLNIGRKPQLKPSAEFLDALSRHSFPGNIRELSNILERVAAVADDVARADHIVTLLPTPAPAARNLTASLSPSENAAPATSLRDLVQEFESWILEKTIAENGSKRSAAKALGIDIATLVRKTKRKR